MYHELDHARALEQSVRSRIPRRRPQTMSRLRQRVGLTLITTGFRIIEPRARLPMRPSSPLVR